MWKQLFSGRLGEHSIHHHTPSYEVPLHPPTTPQPLVFLLSWRLAFSLLSSSVSWFPCLTHPDSEHPQCHPHKDTSSQPTPATGRRWAGSNMGRCTPPGAFIQPWTTPGRHHSRGEPVIGGTLQQAAPTRSCTISCFFHTDKFKWTATV